MSDAQRAEARRREPFMPPRQERRAPAVGLSLLAHGLLVAALAFGVHWRNSEPTRLAAELWSAVPVVAARRAVEPVEPTPTPTPPPPAPPTPTPTPPPAPTPAPPPQPDPQIAIEQQRKAAQAREQAERLDAQKREDRRIAQEREQAAQELQRRQALEKKTKHEQQQAAAQALAASQSAEKTRSAALAAERKKILDRMLGQAGATGDSDSATALRSSAPSATYAGRIMARIKPNIVFTDAVDGNPLTTVEVRLAPDGTIVGQRLIRSSGVKSWDEAVMRAIERTQVLPRDVDGRVPPPFQIDFRLHD